MNKKIAAIILVLTALCITSVIMFSSKEDIYMPHDDHDHSTDHDHDTNPTDEAIYTAFVEYINSTDDLKADTEYYINTFKPDLRKTFDILNKETDELMMAIFSSKKINVDEKVNIIKKEDETISLKIDEVLGKFKSDEYINSFKTIKKFLRLQNDLIYKIAEIYKEEKSFSYDRYTGMLHQTHGDMTQEEQQDLDFITMVDIYDERQK